MKHSHAKPSACCTSFASKADTVLLQAVLCMLCIHMHQLQSSSTHKNVVIWHYMLLCIATHHMYAQSAELVYQSRSLARLADSLLAMFSDESVKLQDLSLNLPTSLLEQKPSLSRLFTKSLLRNEEGRGGQQMLPKLLNKAITTKSTQHIFENVIRRLTALHLQCVNEVCDSQRGNRHTDRHTHTKRLP